MARSKNRKSRRSTRTRNTAAPKNNKTNPSGRNAAGQSDTVGQDLPSSEGTSHSVAGDASHTVTGDASHSVAGDAPPPAVSDSTPAPGSSLVSDGSSLVSAGSIPSVPRGQKDNISGPDSKDSGFYGLSSSEPSAMDDFDDIPLDPSSLDLWFLQDTSALAPLPETGPDDPLFEGDLFDINEEESQEKAPEMAPEKTQDISRDISQNISQKKSQDKVSSADGADHPAKNIGKTPSSSASDAPRKNTSRSGLKNRRKKSSSGSDALSDGAEVPGTSSLNEEAAISVPSSPIQRESDAAGVPSFAKSVSAISGAVSSSQRESDVSGPVPSGQRESDVSGPVPSAQRESDVSAAASSGHRDSAPAAASYNSDSTSRTPQVSARDTGFPRRKATDNPGGSIIGKQPPAMIRQISVYSAMIRIILTSIGILFCLMVVLYFRTRNAGAEPNLGILLPILESHQEKTGPDSSSGENPNAEPDVDINTSPDSVPEDSAAQDDQETVNTEQAEQTDPALSDNPVDPASVQQDSGINADNTNNVDYAQDGYVEENQTYNDGAGEQNNENGNTYNEGETTEENGGDQLGDYYQEGNGYYDDDGRYYEDVERQSEDGVNENEQGW